MKTKQKRQSKSIRKFIRREKARIRSQVFDLKGQEKLIAEVYSKFSLTRDNKETVKK
jgi:hypothetical protein